MLTDDELKLLQAQYEEEQRQLAAELRSVGIDVNSAWRVGKKHADKFAVAIPILLKHLHFNYSDRVREGIARALGNRRAHAQAWDKVLGMYLKEPNTEKAGFKDGLADALAEMALPSDLPTLIQLLDEPGNGRTRVFFVHNLSRSRKPEALAALLRNQNDPQLKPEISHVLHQKELRAARTGKITDTQH